MAPDTSSLFLLLIAVCNGQFRTDFTCLSESERASIKFVNNPNATVPLCGGYSQGAAADGCLPTVRVMQCSYASQCALEWAAYIFMREKLGFDVEFYPTNESGLGWTMQVNDTNVAANFSSNVGGIAWPPLAANGSGSNEDGTWGTRRTGAPGYPENYFWWLWQDMLDMNFEFWGTQYKDSFAFDYILEEMVDFGGFIGAYGEESWYTPKYFADEYPSVIVPDVIKTDGEIRALLINASISGGSQDWYATYPTSAFDSQNASQPTVWGSWASYFMSVYSNSLSKNVRGGLDVNFVTIGSEGNVAKIVNDLYGNRLPFLANIYTVDVNFATKDPVTGDLQKFEKIAFPRNPDQSPYDPCFLNRSCQYPIAPLMKAANTRLKQRFEEAFDFFTGYTIRTTEINKLVSYYLDLAGTSMSGSEKWWNASCTWLKDVASEATWNNPSWLVETQRWDCMSGCGKWHEATNQTRGGHCDYNVGQCVCDYPELFADLHCAESCPGLKWADDDDEDEDEDFLFCFGYGVCDTTTRLCSCEKGHGGLGCQISFSEYELALALNIVIMLFSSILAVACVCCVVWLRMNAKYKTVKALSIDMTTIMTVGLLMVVCSNMALAQSVTSVSCIAWQWLFGLGGICAIMSPLLKAYRVSRVFHGGKMLRAVKITDKMLMHTLLKCALVEVLICTGYTFFHEFNGGTVKFYDNENYEIQNQCNDHSITAYISMGSYGFFFVMLCALTKYSYGTRRALSVFKESTCAYFSSFLSLLCTLIVFVFYMATDDPTFRTAIQCFAIILVITGVLVLFYGTRIYAFFQEPENRNVTDMKAAQSHTNTSFNSSVMKPGPAEPKE